MDRPMTLSLDRNIIPIVYPSGKMLLSRGEINGDLFNILAEIIKIAEEVQSLFEAENKIIALLGLFYDQCNEEIHYRQEDLFNFCCCCVDDLAYLQTLADYTHVQELAFSLSDYHNRNIKSASIVKELYKKLVEAHTKLMMNTVLCFIEMRYKTFNTILQIDNELISVILNNVGYDDLLLWFESLPSWSRFHFFLYWKCLEWDVKKKYFYDPDSFMQRTLRALNIKDNGHDTTQTLRIFIRELDYDEFMQNYFHKFTESYKVCTSDGISTSYNYNFLHYVLPAIITAYPLKVVKITKALTDGQPFFEDLFLVALTIATRKRLLDLHWCLNDHIHYTLQVCQAWVAEQTLQVVVNEISDSKNIFICCSLLRRLMTCASYDRLYSVNILKVLKKFMIQLKSFASKQKKRLKDVSDFVVFLVEFTKARFKEADQNHKQYYYEIFMETRRNLPNFFTTKTSRSEAKTCATLSAKHFLHILKHNKISAEEINCYLQTLLKHNQFHLLEHVVTLEITKYSHRPIDSISSNILSAILAVYRKLLGANILTVKAETIERIILGIIPKQIDTDPNIFVNMDAVLEEAVIDGMKIICHLSNNIIEESAYNAIDYLRLCEHILEYGPSKKLVFEISQLHRATLKQEAIKNSHYYVHYVMENISLITGSNVLIARRSMRRHPSITETMRNILIATGAYEAYTGDILHRRLQDELLECAKSTVDVYFVLATEAQRVIFETKEFPFKNIIRVEQLVMHILCRLDVVLQWEAITALIQLLQAVLSTLLNRDDPLIYQRYFGLILKVTSMVPSRSMTSIAALHILSALRFKDHNNNLQFAPLMQNSSIFTKVLYECTISTNNHPCEAVINLAKDINNPVCLKEYSDETCRAIVALADNLI